MEEQRAATKKCGGIIMSDNNQLKTPTEKEHRSESKNHGVLSVLQLSRTREQSIQWKEDKRLKNVLSLLLCNLSLSKYLPFPPSYADGTIRRARPCPPPPLEDLRDSRGNSVRGQVDVNSQAISIP